MFCKAALDPRAHNHVPAFSAYYGTANLAVAYLNSRPQMVYYSHEISDKCHNHDRQAVYI